MVDSRTSAQPATEPASTDLSGMWLVVLGSILAILAPLGGFLGGTIVGSVGVDSDGMDPLLLWLVAGLGIGGIGVLVAVLGGLRWYRVNRAHPA